MPLFGGARPDHPMADIREAKKLIAEIPAGDSLKALDEATFWLESITRTEGFKVDHYYELFDLLDQAARIHHRRLSQEYLTTDRQEKFRENKLWKTVFEFWKVLGEAYNNCIEQFRTGASGSGAIKNDIALITARAVRILALQLKWVMLRYGPIDERIWGDLGRLYLFAEAKGMATTPIEIYPGAHGHSTVQQEFLKAMMLGVSSSDGLMPLKQEIAERAIAHFSGMFVVQREPGKVCNYYFDTAVRKPAARVLKRTASTPTTRYFGAGDALNALKDLIQEIKSKDGVPPHINLGGSYDTEFVLSVLRHLATYWSQNPPARNSERRKIASRMTVVHGFQGILRSFETNQDGHPLDIQAQDGTESWIVENVSQGGFGAIIPQVQGDWINVGNLLAVQTETAKYWGAGVVRRIIRDEYQQRRVGIQLLSNAVIPVSVAPAGDLSSVNATRQGYAALLLSTTPDKDGEVALLMRAGSYTPGQMLEMDVRGKQYYLIPSRMAEGGEDFDWAKFKVI